MTHEAMIYWYNRTAGAHSYIVGFIKSGRLYYVKLTFVELTALLKADKCSAARGGYNKIRVRVNSDQAWMFIASGKAVEVGTVGDLSADSKHNKGENFERIITEKLTSEKWEKDSVPYYVKGDINVDGEEIQIKLDGAELTNEKTLSNVLKMLGLAE